MYRVEFFTDQMRFASACLISDTQAVSIDYLAFDAFGLKTPTLPCEKGYFVHIAKNGTAILDGIVSDVQPNNGTQTVKLRPLQAMFDVDVPSSPITDAIAWLSSAIQETFVTNADTLQNRPLNVTSSDTAGGLYVSGNTVNLLDVIANALTAYGVVVKMSIDMDSLRINVDIGKQTTSVTLEADLPNVLERKITIGDSYGNANKAYIQETQTVDGVTSVLSTSVFYLHPDGSVDQNDSDRLTPVFFTYKQVRTSETWAEDSLEAAVSVLSPKKFNNEIVLTYAVDDRLVVPLSIPVGAAATIYIDGISYASIFTGFEIAGGRISLTFGEVRGALTKKLLIERRREI